MNAHDERLQSALRRFATARKRTLDAVKKELSCAQARQIDPAQVKRTGEFVSERFKISAGPGTDFTRLAIRARRLSRESGHLLF
jgi:hypothetical protein